MSTVCVLTPIVIGSWPAIAAAVSAAASAMGFNVVGAQLEAGHGQSRSRARERVESEVPNSQVVAEALTHGQKIRIERDGIVVEFGVDERGRCTVCASGEGRSKTQLEKIGQEVAGRVVQQFAYHKLMTELKRRNYRIVEEAVDQDQSIQVRVKLDR